MDALDRHAELVKLSRLLGCDADAIDFLGDADPAKLRRFRAAVTNTMFDDGRETFRRMAALSKRLPLPVLVHFAGILVGPVLAGRIAGEMDPERAARLSTELPTPFLADVCRHMDPKRARAVIAGIAPERIVDIALALAEADDPITMARFVDVLAPPVLQRVIDATPDYGTLLRIGFFVEDKAQLDVVIGLFDDEQTERLVRAAHAGALWPEAIALMAHVGPAMRRRLGDVAARQPEDVLEELVRAVHRRGLWSTLLEVIAVMSPDSHRRIAALSLLDDREVLGAVVAATRRTRCWHVVLPLLAAMPVARRASALEVALEAGVPVLIVAVETAMEQDAWHVVAAIADGLDDALAAQDRPGRHADVRAAGPAPRGGGALRAARAPARRRRRLKRDSAPDRQSSANLPGAARRPHIAGVRRTLVLGLLLTACGGAAEAPPPRAASDEAVAAKPHKTTELSRTAVVETVDAGLGRFLQRVDVEPALLGGRFEGFRIVALRPADFWAGVDLAPGDIVTQVNGMPIERETQAYDAFVSLKTAKTLSVRFIRDGRPRELTLPIVGKPPAKAKPGSAVANAAPVMVAAGNGARAIRR